MASCHLGFQRNEGKDVRLDFSIFLKNPFEKGMPALQIGPERIER